MEVKKAIKKVVALGVGAAMVGTTIMGAMAASLADYPAPFVSDGKFDGHIVVGDNAKAEDVIGATDIISSLQYQMKTTSTVSTGTGSSSVVLEGDSWKAETSSKKLEIGENISSIKSAITSSELNALADGTVKAKNTADYEQELRVSNFLVLNYEEDTDNDKVGSFLTINNNQEILTYKLTFKTASESDIASGELEDLEDASISMLGMNYIVTDTDYDGQNALTLTLMGGAVNDILEEGQTKTYTINEVDYEVTVSYIGSSQTKLTVNGEVSKALADGGTDTVAGIDIGIREILDQNLAGEVDKVEFYLGADKILLYDSDVNTTATTGTMDIGDERMDEVVVDIKGSNSSGDFLLESITLNYTADDDYWLDVGEVLSDKVEEPQAFLNWDIKFEGMSSAETEKISIEPSGDDKLELKAVVADGSVNMPLAYSVDTNNVTLGDNNNILVLDVGSEIRKDEYFFLTTGSGVPTEEEKSYVLQYRGADSSSGDTTATVKFKNLATAETIQRTFTIGGTGKLTLGGEEFTVTNTSSAAAGTDDFSINISAGGASDGYLVTNAGALINISESVGSRSNGTRNNITVEITEADAADMLEGDISTKMTVIINDGDDDEILLDTPSWVSNGATVSSVSDPDDSDVKTLMTRYGAMYTDTSVTSSPDKIEIEWPLSQLTGQVFVTSGATTSTTTSAGGSVETTEIVKIDVGAAVLASEVEGEETANNLILVGGPCANAAASVVMGNPENCAEGFEAGKAKLKLYTHANGKVALLVAGYQAMDTRGAAQFIAKYEENKATFDAATDEIALTVTSLSQISASIPTAE